MKIKLATDGEIKNYQDYSKRIIFVNEDFADKKHFLQTVTIPPRTKQREHFHQKQTEVLYVLEGECLIIINGKEYLAKPGDAFILESGDLHFLWNQSEKEFKLAVFKIDFDENINDTKQEDALT
jgi:quercetin dioxygenase-like cupin family protein